MNTEEFFEFQKRHEDQKLQWELDKIKQESKEQLMNDGIKLITAQIHFQTMGLLAMAFRDD